MITKEIGDRPGEAFCYGNLGTVYRSLGEYAEAKEYLEKALVITKEISDKPGEAFCYGNLGTVYDSLGEYAEAKEYNEKALVITKEIGDKPGEAFCYVNLGTMYKSLGEYGKAETYQKNALVIRKEIGDKRGEAVCYGNLGAVYQSLGEYAEAKEYHEKALAISRERSYLAGEAESHLRLAHDAILDNNNDDAFSNLQASINKYEKMRGFLGHNDQFKISLLDKHSDSYQLLSARYCLVGNVKEALCVLELERGRALADLISGQYSAQQQISANLLSWPDIERIVKNEIDCNFLYISYFCQNMFLWVLKGNRPTLFRKVDVNECFVKKGLGRQVHEVFSEKTFRRFNVLRQEQCEDRSLFFLKNDDSTHTASEEVSSAGVRLLETEEEEDRSEPSRVLPNDHRPRG